MQKTQDRKRQREEDEEEEAEKGPAFSVNPDSLGKAAPPRRTLPSFENMWWTRSVVVPINPHLHHSYPFPIFCTTSVSLLRCWHEDWKD
jgi:hypothetical protein